jgi:glutaryl-CoA dehydrogenase
MRGFTQREVDDKFSLRASSTGELYFDDVRVPEGNRLPEATSLRAPLTCLDRARFGIAWGAVGAAQACLAETTAYARGRKLFGRALTETQLIQSRLAESTRALTGAQLFAFRLAELKEAGAATSAQISIAKWNNVRAALDIARDCRDMLGAAGITAEHCVIRHMLNLESVVTYEGTESIHQLIVGREITGTPSF